MSFCGGSIAEHVAGERHDRGTRITAPGIADFAGADQIATEVLQAAADTIALDVIQRTERRIADAFIDPLAIARTLPEDGIVVAGIEIVVILHRDHYVL